MFLGHFEIVPHYGMSWILFLTHSETWASVDWTHGVLGEDHGGSQTGPSTATTTYGFGDFAETTGPGIVSYGRNQTGFLFSSSLILSNLVSGDKPGSIG
jgi:hypothetical protein